MFRFRAGTIVILLMLVGVATPALAIEWSGYLENSITVNNEDELAGLNKFKLDLKEKKDRYLMMVSGTVMNHYGILKETEYELDRAYLDLYSAWGVVTVGKQRIAWGNSYFFNLVDLFNTVDLFDPKGELAGIDGLSVKWNLTETAQAEGVILPVAKASQSDYGLKFKYTLGLFDMTLSGLKKSALNTAVLERSAYVLEMKGEFSNTSPGVWFQYALNSDEFATRTEDYQSYVLGCDYTFKIGNGLYVLGEYLRDGLGEVDRYYCTSEYNLRNYITMKFSGLYLGDTEASYYSLGMDYQINDNIEFSGTYNYYPEGSYKLGELVNSTRDLKSEVVVKLKTTF